MSQTVTINRMKPLETDDSGGSGAMVSVVLLNDDITPIDYVVEVLGAVFDLNHNDGIQTAVRAHKTGSALIGMYPETKAEKLLHKVDRMNSSSGHSLRCVIVDTK